MIKTLIDDGGAAFPHPGHYSSGMSLRDWFAGQAIAGLLVGRAGMLGNDFSAYAKGYCNGALADRAYALVDAMLAERAKASRP